MPAILLVLVAGYLAALLYRGRLFTPPRLPIRARHLHWAVGLWLGYGVPALAGLVLLGRTGALTQLPPEFVTLGDIAGLPPGSIGFELVAIGLAAGSVLGLGLTWWRARRGKAPWTAGDASSVMPTANRDLLPAAVLAVSAGIVEELFFRLLLPLLVVLVTRSAIAGCLAGTLSFAAMHRYQGWVGVLATLVGGALMSVLYVGSGALWLAIVVHALTDLNSLVLRPALSARWRRRR